MNHISKEIKRVIDLIIIAFLIQDRFPITDEYIEREYMIAGNHLMLTSEHTVREIGTKGKSGCYPR